MGGGIARERLYWGKNTKIIVQICVDQVLLPEGFDE